jgi:hypothetical protein
VTGAITPFLTAAAFLPATTGATLFAFNSTNVGKVNGPLRQGHCPPWQLRRRQRCDWLVRRRVQLLLVLPSSWLLLLLLLALNARSRTVNCSFTAFCSCSPPSRLLSHCVQQLPVDKHKAKLS